jgi:hypothetical protein
MTDDDDIPNSGMLPSNKRPPGRPTQETKPDAKPDTASAASVSRDTPAPTSGIAPSAAQWEQFMNTMRTNKDVDMHVAATIHAQAMKKALRPENEIAPGVSVYNPRGERDFPRPKPTQIYMLARYPICEPGNYDTTTWTEIELLNSLKAGAYRVTKSDGTEIEVLVKAEGDSAGRPYKMTLFADGKGVQDDEQKNNWVSLVAVITQMVTGERPEQSYARYQAIIDAQQAELARLKGAA